MSKYIQKYRIPLVGAALILVVVLGTALVVSRGGPVLPAAEVASPTPVAIATGKPDALRWYFADGASTPPFRTSYAILNPGKETADVTVILYPDNGRHAQRMVRVAPGTQIRVAADTILPNAVFGAEILSTQPVYVERLTLGARDGTTSPGLERSIKWYFPEARCGGDYETRLAILNPDQEAASVTVTFYPTAGASSQQTFEIAAGTRRGILVSQYVAAGTLAMMVHSSLPVVAEHVTHYDAGNAIYGGPGLTPGQLSKTWYVTLANTQTWFSARVAVFNPGDSPAAVRVTVVENKIRKTIPFGQVAAQSKRDINVNDFSGGTRVAMEIASDRKIAVQSMGAYMSNRDGGVVAAYSSLAAPAPAKVWYLPETAGDDDYDSYLSVFNPLVSMARVSVTYIIEDQESLTKVYSVGTLARLTMAVRDEVSGANGRGAAPRVVAVVVNSDREIVADRLTMFRHTVGATASAGIAGQ